jgi:hypothetical protein
MAAISVKMFHWLTDDHVMTLKTMVIDGNQWDTIQGTSMQNKIILNMNNCLSYLTHLSYPMGITIQHDGRNMHG